MKNLVIELQKAKSQKYAFVCDKKDYIKLLKVLDDTFFRLFLKYTSFATDKVFIENSNKIKFNKVLDFCDKNKIVLKIL